MLKGRTLRRVGKGGTWGVGVKWEGGGDVNSKGTLRNNTCEGSE